MNPRAPALPLRPLARQDTSSIGQTSADAESPDPSDALPLVSVIICTYNAGAYLVSALRSIVSQTYSNLQIIIIDDGSTDGSVLAARGVLTDARLQWCHQENRGKPNAFNSAMEFARGKYFVIQDADDLSAPQRIERLVACMESNPDLAAVFSGHDLVIDGTRVAPRARYLSRDECRERIMNFDMPAHDPTGMFRMSLVGQFRFDTSLPFSDGVDFILRIGERHPVMVVGDCLYSYRIHPDSITRRDPSVRHSNVVECRRRACIRRGLDIRDACPHLLKPIKLNHQFVDNNLAAHFIESACDLRRAGRLWEAVKVGLYCARMHPFDFHYLKALIYAASPQWLVKRMRRRATLCISTRHG